MSAHCASSMTKGHRCLLLEFRKGLQYPRADADRLLHGQGAVASRPQPCGADPGDPHELVDDAVRDERLPLFAGSAQHGQVGLVVQQAVQDRGLADPGWALEQDNPGPARADGRELAPQRGEFGLAPDEGLRVVGDDHAHLRAAADLVDRRVASTAPRGERVVSDRRKERWTRP